MTKGWCTVFIVPLERVPYLDQYVPFGGECFIGENTGKIVWALLNALEYGFVVTPNVASLKPNAKVISEAAEEPADGEESVSLSPVGCGICPQTGAHALNQPVALHIAQHPSK